VQKEDEGKTKSDIEWSNECEAEGYNLHKRKIISADITHTFIQQI